MEKIGATSLEMSTHLVNEDIRKYLAARLERDDRFLHIDEKSNIEYRLPFYADGR
jgi:hypothetical protein